MEAIVTALWYALLVHLAIGAVLAVPLHIRLTKLDHAAVGGGWFFRLLITPGLVALWPLLAYRWQRAAGGGTFASEAEGFISASRLRRVHGPLLLVCALTAAVVLVLALIQRPAPTIQDSLPDGLTSTTEAP